jgi:hypothetical protein
VRQRRYLTPAQRAGKAFVAKLDQVSYCPVHRREFPRYRRMGSRIVELGCGMCTAEARKRLDEQQT